jgi:hypothetical protein
MEKTTFSTVNYNVTVEKWTLTVECKKADSTRIYDLPMAVRDVSIDTELFPYVLIFFPDGTHYQLKLESPNEIVIDHFDSDDEIIDEIGAWDFFDE